MYRVNGALKLSRIGCTNISVSLKAVFDMSAVLLRFVFKTTTPFTDNSVNECLPLSLHHAWLQIKSPTSTISGAVRPDHEEPLPSRLSILSCRRFSSAVCFAWFYFTSYARIPAAVVESTIACLVANIYFANNFRKNACNECDIRFLTHNDKWSTECNRMKITAFRFDFHRRETGLLAFAK